MLPAYNAERTLAATIADFPPGCVDEILLVDDGSKDNTVAIAREMGLTVIVHEKNTGYGGNQKTCYQYCLEHGADVVVMIHPDYQYDARVIPHAVGMIELGICDVILGNRVRSRAEALKCGMPWWKYLSNRGLTAFENFALGQNLGEFHSGFRVYRRRCWKRSRSSATRTTSCSTRSSWCRRSTSASGSATSRCRCGTSTRPARSTSAAAPSTACRR